MQTVNPYLMLILDHLLPIVLSMLLSIVGALLLAARSYVQSKWNLTISDANMTKLTGFVDNGIQHAEEWAHNKVVTAEGDATKLPTGAQKMDEAIKFVETEIAAHGLDTATKDRIMGWINARLGTARTEATAAAIAASNATATPMPTDPKPLIPQSPNPVVIATAAAPTGPVAVKTES